MAFWKQFVLSLIVIIAGFAAWVFFVPGAGDTMRAAGIPDNLVSMIAQKAEPAADAEASRAEGQQRGQGQGQGQNRRSGSGRNS
ncbi:efflux transporter periplasmic adaptor subunit, partial [Rhizobium phaseoli]